MTRQPGSEPVPRQARSPWSVPSQKFCLLAEKVPQILVGLAVFLVLAAIIFVFGRHPRNSFPLLLIALLVLLVASLYMHLVAQTSVLTRPSANGAGFGIASSTEIRKTPHRAMVADPQYSYVDGEEACDNNALRLQSSEALVKAQGNAQPPAADHSIQTASGISGAVPLEPSMQKPKSFESPVAFDPATLVPALVGDGLVLNDVQLLAASRIGRGHINDHKPREDSYAVRHSPHGLLAVIADGVGNTRAAHTASDFVSRFMADWQWDLHGPIPWRNQVRNCLDILQKNLHQQNGYLDNGPSATMCFVLLQPVEAPSLYRLWWAALGDSELILVSGAESWRTINEEPQAKNEWTNALPGDADYVETGWEDLDMTQHQVLLATDGFAKPFYRDPAASMRDLNSALTSGDPAYLLAAIRQTGSAFRDDATAVLLAGRRV